MFSAIPLDQAHEQNNAYVKGDGGAIGLTDNATALRRWMVAGPEVTRLIISVLQYASTQPRGDTKCAEHFCQRCALTRGRLTVYQYHEVCPRSHRLHNTPYCTSQYHVLVCPHCNFHIWLHNTPYCTSVPWMSALVHTGIWGPQHPLLYISTMKSNGKCPRSHRLHNTPYCTSVSMECGLEQFHTGCTTPLTVHQYHGVWPRSHRLHNTPYCTSVP